MASEPDSSMEMLTLFPRYVLKGNLPAELLGALNGVAGEVVTSPEASPDASLKLAGQLSQQRELNPQHPVVQELCQQVILPGCERWIRKDSVRQDSPLAVPRLLASICSCI